MVVLQCKLLQDKNKEYRDIEEDLVFRADDTMNYQRNSNLSIEKPLLDQNDDEFRPSFSDLYNKDLITYFKTYFSPFVGGVKYNWNLKTCRIPYLANIWFDEKEQSTPELTSNNLNHSFRYSVNNTQKRASGLEYLMEIFNKNVSMKDLLNFKEGTYYDDGIINTYLRIIDVFIEYSLAWRG